MKTKIEQLNSFGQSIWLDYISRELIDSGQLQKIVDLGVSGVTSNPSIFNKAITSGANYNNLIHQLAQAGVKTLAIYDFLTIKDIQDAADLFMPLYLKTEQKDGFVSLEVCPNLAHDTEGTISEGIRLFNKVNRANVMIKVPSTREGFPAIETLISQGVNINVTLIFSREQYIRSVQAYLKGVKKRIKNQEQVNQVNSVASVFVSRVDILIDQLLEEKISSAVDEQKKKELKELKGRAAVANARLIYQQYKDIFSRTEYQKLANKGVHVQRLLWGSTSTKNPAYSDIKYVTELIGKDTINTMPEKTLKAFLKHGEVYDAMKLQTSKANTILVQLKNNNIEIDEICLQLLKEGVNLFKESFKSLLKSIEQKQKSFLVN